MAPTLFPRHCRLLFTDEEGDGIDLGRLSVRFEVTRSTLGPTIGYARISIVNLSSETTAKLQKKFTRIELEAGYTQRFGTIFKGDVRFVYSMKDGPNRIVEIFANDGRFDFENAIWNGTIPAGTSLRGAVEQIAATFERTPVGSLDTLTDQPLRSNLTEAGPASKILTDLGRDYGFRFIIDGGVAQFLDNLRPKGGAAIEVSPSTGMLESPQSDENSIQFISLLDPRIVPGRRVLIDSAGGQVTTPEGLLQTFVERGDPELDPRRFTHGGRFDVLSVSHYGETRGQPWYTNAYAVPEGRLGGY